eukprot:CAMPEP_0183734132 /NCGR_PEP_ID=MMETSP0737-20130205/42986_1 /TAXON_ID=385413 /ORGANISM="Thalassiosira miniscula, Strain CCMP1093" /LENGTH=361 /DNA_ID=CAMNT_0025967549 /DNA_START=76 /DNA_END=1161 /DNA_ORIENTATION=+
MTETNIDAEKKMFFTTSDLINRMNSAMREANADTNLPCAPSDSGGFELQRKMPDGSYRRADDGEMAAADFQAKMKQASEMIAGLDPSKRIEWAKNQRREGNTMFAKGDYKEAMDVYLTCLVAIDQTPAPHNTNISTMNEVESDNEPLRIQIEREIKLPVLLNLALSALKMGMLSKAEKFCNFAIEMDSGKQSMKAHFRRGSIRMLMGHYALAELDLDKALALSNRNDCDFLKDAENERDVILREKQKLNRLTNKAEQNKRKQKRAMEKLFNSGKNKDTMQKEERGLYPEMKGPKQSTIRPNNDRDTLGEYPFSCFRWYMRMIGRVAQKLLDVIGDDEEDGVVDVEVDQDLLNNLMEDKKNS